MRSNYFKRITAVVLAVCMLLALSACGTSAKTVTEDNASWYICNNLVEEEIENDSDGLYTLYVAYSGLKDTKVQDSINAEIKALFDKLAAPDFYPDLEGAKESFEAAEGEVYKSVCVYTESNINNILSVDIVLNMSKDNADQTAGVYITAEYPLNFDLNTGNQIKLSDLFIDGINAKEYIDGKISAWIENETEDSYSMLDFNLNEGCTYQGITDDQPFSLESQGSFIGLYFDGRNPEYNFKDDEFWGEDYTYYKTKSVYIGMDGVSAVAERFYDESKSLFTSDEKNYVLRVDGYDPVGSTWYTDNHGDDEIAVFFGYPKFNDTPQVVLDYLEASESDADEIYDMVRSKIDELGLSPEEYYCFPSCDISYDTYGNYTTITKSESFSISDADTWDDLYAWSNFEVVNFRGDDPTSLTISDLFKEGVDYKSLLKQANKAYRDEYYDFVEFSDADLDAFADACSNHITGVSIGQDSLYLHFDDAAMGKIAAEMFGEDNEDIWAYEQIIMCALYKDLGCENLTLFE